MIVDTSAILAIVFSEPDANDFEDKIIEHWPRRMSVAALLEATMVAESRGGVPLGRALDDYLRKAQIEFVPVSHEQIEVARNVWRRFGKRNHRAALNFGDCFTYALADAYGEPLLFKGNDFSLTDIQAA